MKLIEDFNQDRIALNKEMTENDEFFRDFGELDDRVYSEGAIPKKYKELTGLSIPVLSKCEECIMYHMQGFRYVICYQANDYQKRNIKTMMARRKIKREA